MAIKLFYAQDDISNIDQDWDKFESRILELIEMMKEEVSKKYNTDKIKK